ncbi:MAG: STAS domain-containing protein [Spirochaetota bacterium]
MITCCNNIIRIESERATLEDKADLDSALLRFSAQGYTEMLIDLGGTNYLPSEMMGLLMWKKKDLKRCGIDLKIYRISGSLKRVFDTAMISDFFELDSAEIV